MFARTKGGTITETINQYCSREHSNLRIPIEITNYSLFIDRTIGTIDKARKVLKKNNIKIALATASPKKLYEPVLRNNCIYNYFDVFCTTEEVGKSKDYPDIYLLAASEMDVSPEDCIVFEDVLKGIVSAKNAGMYTVGVFDKYSDEDIITLRMTADRFIMNFFEMM